MAGNISLTVGTTTVSVTIKGTNANINAAIKRYAVQRGIEVESRTANDIGTDVLRSLLRIMRDGSIDRHRSELVDAQLETINVTVSSENDLFDEPVPPP